jgi:4-amino-4-deoxy-L-arabinose transferase-like glycosyltransferase
VREQMLGQKRKRLLKEIKANHVALALILALAVGLRFYRLADRGLLQSDEGTSWLGVRTQRAALDWAVGRVLGTERVSLREALLQRGGTNPTYAKVGHDALTVLASIPLGMHDYTILVVSAALGSLTVLLVYLIGKRVYDDATGLVAAGVLAALNYHVVFSRSGFSAAAAVFFLVLGFLLYLRSTEREKRAHLWLCLSGLSIGYAFTCHYDQFYPPLVFGAFELVSFCRAGDRAAKLKRPLLFGLSMLAPLLAFEAVYGSAKYVVYAMGMGDVLAQTNFGRFMSYFEQVWNQVGGVSESRIVTRDLLFYPKLLVYFDGYVTPVLAACGLGIVVRYVRQSSLGERIALSLLAVGLFFWTLVSALQFGRSFLLITPLMALFAAKGIVWLTRRKHILVVGMTILVIGYGVYHTLPTLQVRSGYGEAIAYMRAHHGDKHISSMPTVSRVYAGSWNAVCFSLTVSPEEARELYEEGYRYLLWDPSGYNWLGDALVIRANAHTPVFEVAHSTDAFLYETGKGWRDYVTSQPQVLRVYDLESLLD